MRRTFGSLLILFSLALLAGGREAGETLRSPTRTADATGDVVLDDILRGAPPRGTFEGPLTGWGMPRFVRLDFDRLTETDVAPGSPLSQYQAGPWLYSTGGGIPDSSGWSLQAGAWLVSPRDSAENVIESRVLLPGHSDSTQSWFYLRMTNVFPRGGDMMVGIGDGFEPYSSPIHGSPWEAGRWDGTVNDSHNGSVYFHILGSPGEGGLNDTLKTVDLMTLGPGATSIDTTRIALGTLVPPISETPIVLAFHVFGLDSLRYYANGTSGTMKFARSWQSQPGDDSASIVIAQRPVIGARWNTRAVKIQECWAAGAPR
jgi:hypothetical protein